MRLSHRAVVFTACCMVGACLDAAVAGVVWAQQPPRTVLPGDSAVRGSQIETGRVVFHLVAVTPRGETELGTLDQEIARITENGVSRLRLVQVSAGRMGNGVDTAFVDGSTLAPVRLRGHNDGGTLSIDFAGARVTGERRDHEGSGQPIDQELAQPVFDSNAIDLLVRSLPLIPGTAVRVPVYIYEQGGLVWYDIRVAAPQTGSAPAVREAAVREAVVSTPDGEIRYVIDASTHSILTVDIRMGGGTTIRLRRAAN